MNNNLIMISEEYDPSLVASYKLPIPVNDIDTDGYDFIRDKVEEFTDGEVILTDEEIKELVTDGIYWMSELHEGLDARLYLTDLMEK